MLLVALGNAHPVETYRDADDHLRRRVLSGRRVTRMMIPEDVSVSQACATVVSVMHYHFERGHTPAWVWADNDELRRLLCKQFRLDPKHEIPADWEAA